MQLVKFCLGYRFHDEVPKETICRLLFDHVPYQDLAGCRILLAKSSETEVLPYQSKILVLVGFPLSQARKAHKTIQHILPWMAALAEDTPILEKNYLVHCTQIADLGTVQADGSVAGGMDSIGSMQFAVREAPSLIFQDQYLILGDAGFCREALQAFSKGSRVGMPHILQTPGEGDGLVTSLVRNLSGRYIACPDGGYIGLLPDGSAVVDADSPDNGPSSAHILGKRLLFALEKGYTRILFPDGEYLKTDGGQEILSLLKAAYPDRLPQEGVFILLASDPAADFSSLKLPNLQVLPMLESVFDWAALKNRIKDCTHLVLSSENFDALQRWLKQNRSGLRMNKKTILCFDPKSGALEAKP